MGAQTFLIVLFVLASSSSLTSASDPGPLQDFCIAVQNPDVFVNGRICKNPKDVTANDFLFTGFGVPGNTSNRLRSAATLAFVEQFPAVNTLGVAMGRIDIEPYGLNQPHTHPLASEMFLLVEGTLYVGFITSNPDNRLFTKILRRGEIFVFPQGLIHFQLNVGDDNALAFAAFGSQNPGRIDIAPAAFGSNPPISEDILAQSFQLDWDIVDDLLAKSWRS